MAPSSVHQWALVAGGCLLAVAATASAAAAAAAAAAATPRLPPRVAIIGGGVAGTSAAYFLRDALGPNAELHLYEGGAIGGRASTVTIGGGQYERGGAVIHRANQYLVNFTRAFRLRELVEPPQRLGVWDGDAFVFEESAWGGEPLNVAKLLWRYGLSLRKLDPLIARFLDRFARVYPAQARGDAFDSVRSLLAVMTPPDGGADAAPVFNRTQQSARDFLVREEGFDARLVDELFTAVTRANYGQGLDTINAFTGLVSLAGAQDDALFGVYEGNDQIPWWLLSHSSAGHYQERVVAVRRRSGTRRGRPSTVYDVLSRPGGGAGEYEDSSGGDDVGLVKRGGDTGYDFVVIAAPLEEAAIRFDGFPAAAADEATDDSASGGEAVSDKESGRRERRRSRGLGPRIDGLVASQSYQQTVATFVTGKLRRSVDRCFAAPGADDCTPTGAAAGASSLPTAIFTTGGNGTFFSSVGLHARLRSAAHQRRDFLQEKLRAINESADRIERADAAKDAEMASLPVDDAARVAWAAKGEAQATPTQRMRADRLATQKELKALNEALQRNEKGTGAYKVFSPERLTPAQLASLFDHIEHTDVTEWRAYPRYQTPQRFLPFVLDRHDDGDGGDTVDLDADDESAGAAERGGVRARGRVGVCYANAIEWAASAMEMSAIAARNCANHAVRTLRALGFDTHDASSGRRPAATQSAHMHGRARDLVGMDPTEMAGRLRDEL